MIKILFAITGITAIFIGFFYLVLAQTGEGLKIGVMLPLTGDVAEYGDAIRRGVEIAVIDSGLSGLEVIHEDSRCDPELAEEAMRRLASQEGLIAVIGEACSGATLAAAPVASENRIVLISPASTSPNLSDAGDYVFRTVPGDQLQGRFGAELVYAQGHRRLAIIYTNEDYGIGYDEVLSEEFEELGGEIVARETIERGQLDVVDQLRRISVAEADAVYLISNSVETSVALLRQLSQIDMHIAVFGSEALKSDGILRGALETAEGMTVVAVSEGTAEFAQKHREIYGIDPGPFAAQGHDAFVAVASAIKKRAQTAEDIKNMLYEIEFVGASGSVKFDEKGDVSGNYDIFEVRNNEFVRVEN